MPQLQGCKDTHCSADRKPLEKEAALLERVSPFHIFGRRGRWWLSLPEVHRAAADPSVKRGSRLERRAGQAVPLVSLAACVIATARGSILTRFQRLLVGNRRLAIERSDKCFRSPNGYDLDT